MAEKPEITGEEALLGIIKKTSSTPWEKITSIPANFNLQSYLDDLTVQWLEAAMEQAHDNKSEAAKLLSFKNYQTLSNWLEKYGV